MRLAKVNMALSVLVTVLFLGFNCYAQPNIPKENIPSNLSTEVKAEVEGLYAPEAVKRAQAASNLGNMGEKAVPAIPLLIGMLGDSAGIELKTDPESKISHHTSPGIEAAVALGKIGNPAVAAYGKSLKLVQNQYAAGIVAKADVVQAQTQIKTAQAQAIDIGAQRAQLEHAIALLVGKPPAQLSIPRRRSRRQLPPAPTRIALGTARAPPRHRSRRAAHGAGERANRRGQSRLFPGAHAVGIDRLPERDHGRLAHCAEPLLVVRPGHRPEPVRRRPAPRADGTGDSGLRRQRGGVPPDCADRISAGGGQPRHAAHTRAGSGGTGRSGETGRASAGPGAQPVQGRHGELSQRRGGTNDRAGEPEDRGGHPQPPHDRKRATGHRPGRRLAHPSPEERDRSSASRSDRDAPAGVGK